MHHAGEIVGIRRTRSLPAVRSRRHRHDQELRVAGACSPGRRPRSSRCCPATISSAVVGALGMIFDQPRARTEPERALVIAPVSGGGVAALRWGF
jgi:hypothetical protein